MMDIGFTIKIIFHFRCSGHICRQVFGRCRDVRGRLGSEPVEFDLKVFLGPFGMFIHSKVFDLVSQTAIRFSSEMPKSVQTQLPDCGYQTVAAEVFFFFSSLNDFLFPLRSFQSLIAFPNTFHGSFD